ncbi:hypothetical protein [Acinetobacter beijerinckii]|uniref:hypothetical protein n=1 Tax=Acinetobacter beijerinckii TaxID=262668 RepID=UPI003AF7FC04
MDACSIDWDLVSKFTPYILAFIAYRIWHMQKGREVIANEAKEFLYNLSKLESLQSEIESKSNSNTEIQEFFDEYKSTKEKMSNNANFLGLALKKDKTLSHLSTSYLAQCIIYIRRINLKLSENKSYELTDIPHPNDAFLLNEHLLRYALYKSRTCKSRILSITKGYYHP